MSPRPSFTSSRPLPGRGNTLRRLSLGLVSTSLLGSWASPSLWALQSAVVRGESVNVRGQASLAGEVLVQLNQGDIIQMVDKIVAVGAKAGSPSRWAQIQLPPSVPVYVHASFLDGDTVAATRLNIRGGAGENYSVLGSLQRGDKIHSLGKQGGWVRIRPTPETYAFVAADYVVKAPSPAPAARPVVAKVASPPTVVAPIPVIATVPAPRVIPPAPPTVAAESVAPERTSSHIEPPPIIVAQTTPTVASTTPPPVSPEAAAPIAPSAVPTLVESQAVTPDEPLEDVPAKGASSPDAPDVSTTETAPTEQTSPHVDPPATILAQATPAPTFNPPASVAPPVSPEAAAPIAPSAVPTLAQAQPFASTQPLEKRADKPADSSTSTPPTEDQVGRLGTTLDGPRRKQISFGYRLGMNSSVEFKGFAAAPKLPSGIFDDGYVLDSSRQTAGPNSAPDGRTWNWGYDNPAQVQGDTLLLTHSYPQAGTDSHKLDDLVSGFELTYSLELYRGGSDESFHFGMEAAFNYSALSIKSTWAHSMNTVRDTTAYQLGGVVPPYDPLTGQTYQGNYGGPGPTIPLNGTPSQITIPNGPPMTTYRELVANTYGLRLGPYFESPLYKKLSGTVGMGLAIGLADGELRYADTVQSLPLSGTATDFSALVGWYFGGGLSYKWSDSWSLFYNAQYQWLPDYTLTAGPTEARIKAGNGLFQSIGIRYSF